mgnify:CR=1 FL=1
MSDRELEFVLYQNPLSILNLDAIGIEDDPDVLVVELSASSIFAPVFDQQAKLRFGLAGLLGDFKRVDTLPRVYQANRRKILLGSRPSVSTHASVAALSELASLDTSFQRIIIMLHLSEVDKFIYGLQLASTFSILLKRGDVVPVGLLRAVDRLERLGAINQDSWKGLAFYGGDDAQSVDQEILESLKPHLRPLLIASSSVDTAA